MSEILLTPAQIAKRLGCKERHARVLMMEMQPINIGAGNKNKAWRVRPSALDKWIEDRTKQPEYGVLTLVQPQRPRKRAVKHAAATKLINGKIPYRKTKQSHG